MIVLFSGINIIWRLFTILRSRNLNNENVSPTILTIVLLRWWFLNAPSEIPYLFEVLKWSIEENYCLPNSKTIVEITDEKFSLSKFLNVYHRKLRWMSLLYIFTSKAHWIKNLLRRTNEHNHKYKQHSGLD